VSDQATKLRELARMRASEEAVDSAPGSPPVLLAERKHLARVIAVTSGKGGVGKTHVSVNLAVALALRGKRVVIFDADLGLANVDILLGLKPVYTLSDVVAGSRDVFDILLDGPAGVQVVPGASGIPYLANLGPADREHMLSDLARLESAADVLVIDTGAGISETTTSFVSFADEILVVATPEATSITDAYAMIKVISRRERHGRFSLVVNMAQNRIEAERVSGSIRNVAREFLGTEVHSAGHIVRDQHIALALRKREPFVLAYPSSQAAACIRSIAAQTASRIGSGRTQNKISFFSKIRSFFQRSAL
jgi:flagellar biosynthesis protein FlhG